MVDVLTPEQRRYNMSMIRGKNTTPEMKLRKLLYASGIRGFRIHSELPGKPDIVFIRKKIAVFIDGCFWHKCPVDFVEPETRKEFWMNKIMKNVERDKEVIKILESQGWKVVRFWEHEVRKQPEEVIARIKELLE